jgi:hypothetical protein
MEKAICAKKEHINQRLVHPNAFPAQQVEFAMKSDCQSPNCALLVVTAHRLIKYQILHLAFHALQELTVDLKEIWPLKIASNANKVTIVPKIQFSQQNHV